MEYKLLDCYIARDAEKHINGWAADGWVVDQMTTQPSLASGGSLFILMRRCRMCQGAGDIGDNGNPCPVCRGGA